MQLLCCDLTWCQVHKYLYLSTNMYTYESTCTLLKYFFILAGVLVLILKCLLYIVSICKYLNTYKYFQVLLSTESKLGGVQITYFNMSKFCADAN